MKKTFHIRVNGCDDSTWIEFDLTETQLNLLQKVACAVNNAAADVHCMPTLVVFPVGEQEPEPYCEMPDGAA